LDKLSDLSPTHIWFYPDKYTNSFAITIDPITNTGFAANP